MSLSDNEQLLNEVITEFFDEGSVDEGKTAMENAIKVLPIQNGI